MTTALHSLHLQHFYHDFSCYQSACPAHATLNDKLTACAKIFQGRPYQFDPIGDGQQADIDTRSSVNTQAFDCFSFCNVVLAMIHSDTPQQALKNLDLMRYHTFPKHYFNRFHFVESEWNTTHRNRGVMTNITPLIFNSSDIHQLTIQLNLPQWALLQKKYLASKFLNQFNEKDFAVPRHHQYPLTVDVDYIPLDTVLSNPDVFLTAVPAASICQLVCKNWQVESKIGTPLAICHLGFITYADKIPYFHQAELNAHISSTPLLTYLQQIKKRHSHIHGIRLEGILPQSHPHQRS